MLFRNFFFFKFVRKYTIHDISYTKHIMRAAFEKKKFEQRKSTRRVAAKQ